MAVRWVTIGFVIAAFGIGAAAGVGGAFWWGARQEAAQAALEEVELERLRQSGEEFARPYFDDNLVDPESLQMRNVRLNGMAICGEFNARNRSGGYNGFRRFIIRDWELYTFVTDADEPSTYAYYEHAVWSRNKRLQDGLWLIHCGERPATIERPPEVIAADRAAIQRERDELAEP